MRPILKQYLNRVAKAFFGRPERVFFLGRAPRGGGRGERGGGGGPPPAAAQNPAVSVSLKS